MPTDAELAAALLEWAAGRASDNERRRAHAVAAALDGRATPGVSRSSLYRWAASARARGPRGLADAARTGRPARQPGADAVVASLLASAGSRCAWGTYSSRGMAEMTHLPQSLVARSIRALAGGPGDGAEATLAVRAVHADRGVQALLVPTAPVAPAGSRAVRSRRIAAVFAALRVAGFGSPVHPVAPPREPPPVGEEVLLSWQPGEDWGAFRAHLQAALWRAQDVPGALLDALSAEAHSGLAGFDWIAGPAPVSSGRIARVAEASAGVRRGARGTNSRLKTSDSPELSEFWLPAEDVSLTERVAAALRAEIVESGYRPGDAFAPQRLARDFGLPRATVDAAILRLGDEGILDAGLRIPHIDPTDVVDLYAARLGLGTMIMRNIATREPAALQPVRRAMERVSALARAGERAAVAEADLRFQQELARCSGLGQTGRTFENLTLRLRMLISILRLDYAPAAQRIVRDDRLIVVHLIERHPEDAVRVWRGKLDHAVRHMISRLDRPRFDTELWQRLTSP